MKIQFILSLLFAVNISASVYSQQTKLTIQKNNISVKDVLNEIEESTEFRFFLNNEEVNIKRKVDLNVKDESINNILRLIFKGQDINYEVSDKNLILISKEAPQSKRTISGKVTDSKGGTLPGVSVMEKGTDNGVVTDENGNYSLEVFAGAKSLVFSFIGMKKQEVLIGAKNKLDVVMQEDLSELDEVVVVGYGTVKKSNLTGAVSTVKTKELPKSATTSVAHMLTGKAAGLTISQNSAQPGGGISLQIRGSATGSSPLIIVDGFPLGSFGEPGSGNRYSSGNKENMLNSINPNDIESIEVLKDAGATAIYGSRASGGVIIITTKRGQKGKVQVSYKGSRSIQKIYGMVDMLSPKEFMSETNKVRREIWMRSHSVEPYGTKTWDQAVTDATANNKPLYSDRYSQDDIKNFTGGTDWLDNITRTGVVDQHDVTVTAGSDKTKYLFSAGYYKNDGVVKGNQFKRYTARLNLDQEITKWLKAGISSNISQIIEDNVALGGGQFESSSVIRSALQFNPLLPLKDEDGNFSLDPNQSYLPNPVSLLDIQDESKTERFLVTSFLEAEPIKDFKIRLTVGADRSNGYRNTYLPTTTMYGKVEGGKASKRTKQKTDKMTNLILTYNKKIGVHDFNIMGGYEYNKYQWEGFNAMNSKMPYDGMSWNNLGAGEREKPGVGSYGGSSEVASYVSRINYSLLDRYLFTFNFRADGSSDFSENNKWGYFPGASFAWRVSEEPFMEFTKDWLSSLKLRSGYGQTGKGNIGDGVNTYYSIGWNYAFNGKKTNGIGLSKLGNPDLKWETQTDFNVGLDFGLFKGRISGTLEYYNRVITDIIGNKNLMSYHEVSNIKYNLDAKKQTRGFELTLNTVNFKGDFNWNSSFTLTYYRDRWLKRDESWKPDIHQNETDDWYRMMYWESDGLVQPGENIPHMPGAIPGTVKIKDVNGYLLDEDGKRVLDDDGKPMYSGAPDGKLDNADLVYKGTNVPVTVGFTNSFSYKGFDLNIYINGMFNRWRTNSTKKFYVNEAFRMKDGSNMMAEITDRWSYDNQTSDTPSIFQPYSNYGTGDYYLENAWFVRLKNINVGYTLPEKWVGKAFTTARIFMDAQNLLVITPYSGTDPETDSMAAYPNQRTFTLGVELKF